MQTAFKTLSRILKGRLYYQDNGVDNALRMVYATDASIFKEKPLAVSLPETVEDIKALVDFALENKITLIPRAAGTSLSGQVVGSGIVVDLSKHFTNILEINAEEKWVRVQPGVIRDDLNKFLHPYGLMFGPETSSASRAMMGGMVGNNSCGLHSIRWGSTRNHLIEVKAILSDGTGATFKSVTPKEIKAKLTATDSLEANIYRSVFELLSQGKNQQIIAAKFPEKSITRRNTGYALDSLINTVPFGNASEDFNFCKLIAGSEGTLCFLTEIKVGLLPLPLPHNALLTIHCSSLREAMIANQVAMQHAPYASELVDKFILDFTKSNLSQMVNRFFIQGDPEAILMVEFFAQTLPEAVSLAEALAFDLKKQHIGYAYPVLTGTDINKAWDVRKSGLGLLRNMPGDNQPVNLIEDCAVSVADLPEYTNDMAAMLKRHGVSASYYAHAGAGELHIEPMINLKTAAGKKLFRQILTDTVELLKKYNGSLSGEHGDGRLRGEFIPVLMGPEVYALFREIKDIFDPHHIFNAGKIVDTPPMDEFLRYNPGQDTPDVPTVFGFRQEQSILRLAEKCSGSGDCRKTALSGGTMCPSYMATRQEKDTTRARANILRDFLTNSNKANRFDHDEIKEVMDLCLSCKGCKSECPSGVDVSKMKAEFLQHYYDANGTPMRSKMIGNISRLNGIASKMPSVYNFMMTNKFSSSLAKQVMGFARQRPLPLLHPFTFKSWFYKWKNTVKPTAGGGQKILFFADEFTNYNDVQTGINFVQLFSALGYDVDVPNHIESGRAFLSKGLVRNARQIAIKNVTLLSEAVASGTVLLGVEPSAILTLRDEYLDLVPDELLSRAKMLAAQTFYVDEFFAAEIKKGNIRSEQFTTDKKEIKLHGHCHQKVLSALSATVHMLSLPANYRVDTIPSGCCGMAGSFGYEAEHYDVSMKIGELVLFPAVRNLNDDILIAAPGTSCRHQIKDGTGKKASHPVDIMWEALKKV
jgi:FAD/FMN-containing dehydrogenase/Fe-S oxidoreductase